MSSGADGLSIYKGVKAHYRYVSAPFFFFSLSLHFIPPLLLDALAQLFRRISSDESSSTS